MKNFTKQHLSETAIIASTISQSEIESVIDILVDVRLKLGRLFFLGIGGSAANASHAVNDFRKLASIESYSPTDNVSELTARTNDDGWHSVFASWLKTSKLNENDCIFVLSVGGGNKERGISTNLCDAIDYAKTVSAKIVGIVGKNDGYTSLHADSVIEIPVVNVSTITPHAESFQQIIWHLMVSHPKLKVNATTW